MILKPAPEAFQLLNRHVGISPEVFEKLGLYYQLLISWQNRINLISPLTLDKVWQRHILDSAQLLKLIPDLSDVLLDVGSGAGFPGMVLAILGASNVHLIDRNTKKIAFLREVSRITNITVTLHQGDIESQPFFYPEVITARAFAPLGTLLDLIARQVSHGTICLFPKGKNWSMEMEDAKERWSFEYDALPSVTDDEGVILRLTHIEKR